MQAVTGARNPPTERATMLELIFAVLAAVMPVCDTEDSHQCTWTDESAVHVNVGPVTDDPATITIH